MGGILQTNKHMHTIPHKHRLPATNYNMYACKAGSACCNWHWLHINLLNGNCAQFSLVSRVLFVSQFLLIARLHCHLSVCYCNDQNTQILVQAQFAWLELQENHSKSLRNHCRIFVINLESHDKSQRKVINWPKWDEKDQCCNILCTSTTLIL